MAAIKADDEILGSLSGKTGSDHGIHQADRLGLPETASTSEQSSHKKSGGSVARSGDANLFYPNAMNRALLDFYLCPEHFVDIAVAGELSREDGYFRFGPDITCYGKSSCGYRAVRPEEPLYDVLTDVVASHGSLNLPFDLTEIIDNLTLERYASRSADGQVSHWERSLKDIYYVLRPLMPIQLRKHIQRARLAGWRGLSFPRWPVDTTVEDLCEKSLQLSMKAKGIDRVPFIWFWPDGAQTCVTMTHDVETEKGRDFCTELMNIDESFGVRASFQIVPESRYEVSEAFLRVIGDRGFEVNVQDLNHDGNLFRNRNEFQLRAQKINKFAETHGIAGFRAAVLYRALDWYDALHFSFDMSVPNVAHLDPQKGGCCTVMPYFFGNKLEIPVTATQDYMLFHLLNDYSLSIWKKQINSIMAKNGLVSFIVHPDYVIEKKARVVYEGLLSLLRALSQKQQMWFALPGEIDRWWRMRHAMRIVGQEGNWQIEGEGAELAKLAFAQSCGDRLKYIVGN